MEGAPLRVAVAGAAGRMGTTVCEAVQGAPDMELVARADPALGLSVADALACSPDVLVDFTVPGPRARARQHRAADRAAAPAARRRSAPRTATARPSRCA